jgi:hypothetical protein
MYKPTLCIAMNCLSSWRLASSSGLSLFGTGSSGAETSIASSEGGGMGMPIIGGGGGGMGMPIMGGARARRPGRPPPGGGAGGNVIYC